MGRMIDIPLSKSIAIFLLSTEAKNNYITNTLFFIYYYCFILAYYGGSPHGSWRKSQLLSKEELDMPVLEQLVIFMATLPRNSKIAQ
ncbi:Uncharacterised protein [Bacillus subtilis]|nr:hypothetical protein NRS6185_01524 [Bacillus subtilis]SPY20910.1 Uncharacterised protein [Bacillus subtilis]